MWLYFSSDYTWVKGGNYLFTILYLYNCFLFICRYADRSDRSVFSNPVILHPDLSGESVLIYWKKGPVLLGDGRYVGDLVNRGHAGGRMASPRSADVQNWSLLRTESNAGGIQIQARQAAPAGLRGLWICVATFSKSCIELSHMASTSQAEIHWSH